MANDTHTDCGCPHGFPCGLLPIAVADAPGSLRMRMRDDQTASGSANNYAVVSVMTEHARRAAFARAALWVKLRELDEVCAERDRLDDASRRLVQECRDLAVHCERFDADLDAAIRGNLRRAR